MPCKTVTEEIGEITYSCTQYPAIVGMQYKFKLIKILGPAFHEILPVLIDKKSTQVEQTTALISAVDKIFTVAEPQEVVELLVSMLTTGNTKRGGKRLDRSDFEQVYAGDGMLEAYKAFAFVVRVNYGSLLVGQEIGNLLAQGSHTTETDTQM